MRFQVPQFIETETKIVGPFTLKQFLWVASGVALMFLMFLTLPIYAFVILSIPTGALFGALAFVKIDNIPLFNYFVYGIGYTFNPRRYFFRKTPLSDMAADELVHIDRPTPSHTFSLKTPVSQGPKTYPKTTPMQKKSAPTSQPEKDQEIPESKDAYISREYIVR